MPAILTAENLCKSFASDGLQNHVLKNICLEIEEGQFTVVMGASGSGKSTLLYCLSAMDQATSGSLYYGKQQLQGQNDRQLAALRSREFGFIFQQIHLIPNLSLLENIMIPGYLTMSAKDAQARATALLEQVSLEGLGKRLPTQVSGGQAQRAAVARALINSPTLLFADEPTGALNSSAGQEILDLLTSINQAGQTVVMVTHDVKAATRASRLLYLKDGIIGDELILAKYDISNIASDDGNGGTSNNATALSARSNAASNREAQVVAWLNSFGW